MKTLQYSWNNLAARIQGLEEAILSFARIEDFLLRGSSTASVDRDKYLLIPNVLAPSLRECFIDIKAFRDEYKSSLGKTALECFDRFEKATKSAIGEGATTGSFI